MKRIAPCLLMIASLASCRSPETLNPKTPMEDPLFPTVEGPFTKGDFIDLGKADRLYIRYQSISDSGIELERITDGKIVWRVQSEPLGVAHSKYGHEVVVCIDGSMMNIVDRNIFGGSFCERRRLDTGELIERTERSRLPQRTSRNK